MSEGKQPHSEIRHVILEIDDEAPRVLLDTFDEREARQRFQEIAREKDVDLENDPDAIIAYRTPDDGYELHRLEYAPEPDDVEPTVASRVAKIEAVFRAFYDADVNNDPEANVSDLLADVRHFCQAHSLDFAAVDRRAYRYYIVEAVTSVQDKESTHADDPGDRRVHV